MNEQKIGPLQEKWLQALESGKYQQAIGHLCQETADGTKKYCCLGVACELLRIRSTPETLRYKGEKQVYAYDAHIHLLSKSTAYKMGLRDRQGSFGGVPKECGDNFAYESLDEMNDDNWTFEEIAQFVRENPEIVFKRAV